MNILDNLQLLPVGLAMVAIGILGFVVYFNDRRSLTNQTFLWFALVAMGWNGVNYAAYQFDSSAAVLWLLRLTLFFAVWYSFCLFQFFYVFPRARVRYPRWYLSGLIPAVASVSLVTLTPLAIVEVKQRLSGGSEQDVLGPGMLVFGATVVSLIVAGIIIFFRKLERTAGPERRPFRLVFFGTGATFLLYLIFNFVFPVFFHTIDFIPLGAVFTLPLIACTAYAIIKHKLFNVKIIATEILTFVLSMALLFDVIGSDTLTVLLYRGSVLLLVFAVGILLIKSVRKEVKDREEKAALAASLEKANLRLQELDKQKTEFLSIASHQLRTPMSILKGYIELIHDGAYGKASPALKKVLTDMDTSNERLVKLVDEFLNISRIEQGRTKFTFAKASMVDLIGSVVTELTGRAAEKKLQLQWQSPKTKHSVTMDEDKIRHVVFNFVDNAIKYTASGSVGVAIEREGNGVAVRVRDSGIGFGKKDEANFFQKFYRGDNVKATHVEGTGLGLFVCQKFIEAHGGRVWGKSLGLGKGSEFGFWIPAGGKLGNGETEEISDTKK